MPDEKEKIEMTDPIIPTAPKHTVNSSEAIKPKRGRKKKAVKEDSEKEETTNNKIVETPIQKSSDVLPIKELKKEHLPVQKEETSSPIGRELPIYLL